MPVADGANSAASETAAAPSPMEMRVDEIVETWLMVVPFAGLKWVTKDSRERCLEASTLASISGNRQ
ncbi:hypothetical protein MMUR_13290 [Mycolicibacterium murale]|uniref:Uncharacterized protein n=1 Tax=Mycolicibacterium murale TaxID=182220 RepID=A0A7I9WHR8_9MYCO|nr:hypothetical protein MMUR_13290 [Mycolicibacterium murale]